MVNSQDLLGKLQRFLFHWSEVLDGLSFQVLLMFTCVQFTTFWGRCSKEGVPNLWDLMPDDLRWSRCNNNRNKVQNKCNVLESPQNLPTLVCVKIIFHDTCPWCQKGWGPWF